MRRSRKVNRKQSNVQKQARQLQSVQKKVKELEKKVNKSETDRAFLHYAISVTQTERLIRNFAAQTVSVRSDQNASQLIAIIKEVNEILECIETKTVSVQTKSNQSLTVKEFLNVFQEVAPHIKNFWTMIIVPKIYNLVADAERIQGYPQLNALTMELKKLTLK